MECCGGGEKEQNEASALAPPFVDMAMECLEVHLQKIPLANSNNVGDADAHTDPGAEQWRQWPALFIEDLPGHKPRISSSDSGSDSD